LVYDPGISDPGTSVGPYMQDYKSRHAMITICATHRQHLTSLHKTLSQLS